MRIKLIFPKQKVSEDILWLTPQKDCEESRHGDVYHNCFGFLINLNGHNIAYVPFGNGAFIKVDNAVSMCINYDFHYSDNFFGFCRLLRDSYAQENSQV